MKKTFSILFIGVALNSLQAQDINDALRYSQTDLNGTARYRAMGGAFGAVGGDFSSLNSNPAGSLIFANNQAGLTLTNFSTNNDSNYFGKKTSDNNNSFALNQAGAAFIFNNADNRSDWKKFAFTLNYENARNLDNSIISAGTNPTNSVDKYFLNYANGVALGTLNNYYFDELYYNEQQAYLGYNSYIFDPTSSSNSNTSYYSNVALGGNYYQENRTHSTGYNGKVAFNFAGQYTDKWLFGLNLNSHFIDYRQTNGFYESNTNPKYTTGSTVDVIRFSNDLYTYGSGFSFQLGTIYKLTKKARLGLSYESPTWYRLTDELSQRVTTSGYGLSATPNVNSYSTQIVDPNTTMIFQPYTLQSPGKWTGSFAYIFSKKGLISIDLASKNYSFTSYGPKVDFSSTNTTMRNALNSATELRVGGEYKIKRISLRGGYRWEQSPYKNGTTIGDLTCYSGGLGYNFGNTKLDLAYSNTKREYDQQFFSQGLTDAARIKSVINTISLTLLFEL